ncbi:Uroporphyrinogen-III decarboxylase [Mycobacteroides abscessus subsp. massiliense]|uniref:ankyrin repeat domain-containing protein n=1 Tax=Mycobacteroides abscessus TaxID=36809 RepID=UPI0009D55D04|nr:ankyrin repeat domain-containing protein [Mycobacteroides abscessus]SKU70910.1 Uroporphyrinogen-III decarboxylase [Mycobacteroides abscessus subsp. massiliense]SKU75924.1 Uroporphyrinogen-III decarboxylase [Mycobacteroides abscessus subsp. massiliense]
MARMGRAGVHDRDEYGRTPLHYAVLDGPEGSANDWKLTDPAEREEARKRTTDYRLANCERLIASGADVNAREGENWTPLHFAARTDSPEVVRLLLDSGADIDAINGRGETPITIAAGSLKASGSAVLELLHERGADLSLKGDNGVSVIQYAKMVEDPTLNNILGR